MTPPPLVQAGHVPHKAALLIPGDSCHGSSSSCDDHMVSQGDTAGTAVINDMMTNQKTKQTIRGYDDQS